MTVTTQKQVNPVSNRTRKFFIPSTKMVDLKFGCTLETLVGEGGCVFKLVPDLIVGVQPKFLDFSKFPR